MQSKYTDEAITYHQAFNPSMENFETCLCLPYQSFKTQVTHRG